MTLGLKQICSHLVIESPSGMGSIDRALVSDGIFETCMPWGIACPVDSSFRSSCNQ